MSIITSEQIELLEGVRNGADIFGYKEANQYRELESLGLVHVCKAMGDYHEHEQRPYFGAILNAAGKAAIKGPK